MVAGGQMKKVREGERAKQKKEGRYKGKVALQMAIRLGGFCLRQEIGKNRRWQKCNPGSHTANTQYVFH